jgi:transposase
MKRALGLLALDQGATLTAVAQHQQVTIQTVGHWRDGYAAKGLACLQDAPRAGRPVRIDGVQRAQITALACSTPPPGHSQWSLRLLADKVVELDYCEAISHTYVGEILKKTNSSRI